MAGINNIITKASGSCILCLSQANLVCHRCGDFYCTQKCQLNDWHRHRYLCFPIPPLVRPMEFSVLCDSTATPATKISQISTLATTQSCVSPPVNAQLAQNKMHDKLNDTVTPMNKMAATKPHNVNDNGSSSNNTKVTIHKTQLFQKGMPPKYSMVSVMGFRTPNRWFIRNASEAADKAYSEVCEKVHILGEKQPLTRKLVNFGYALAKYNGMFRRVKILFYNKRLQLVDLGMSIALSGIEMREISEELLRLPCCVVEVQALNIPNYGWTDKVSKSLHQFVGEKCLLSSVNKDGVELRRLGTETTINELVRELCSNQPLYGLRNPVARSQQGTNSKEQEQQGLGTECQNTVNCKTEGDNNLLAILKSVQLMENNVAEEIEPSFSKEAAAAENVLCNIPRDTTIEAIANDALKSETAKITEISTGEALRKTTTTTNEAVLNEAEETKCAVDKTIYETMQTNPAVTTAVSKTSLSTIGNHMTSVINGLSKLNLGPVLNAPFDIKRPSDNTPGGFDIFIVDNANMSQGILGAFNKKFADDFSKVIAFLCEFSDTQPYSPVVEEFVIAKFENSWYRAKVINIKKDQTEVVYNVMYLDYTSVGTVTSQDIRRYPADLTVPCHTNVFLLKDFPYKLSNAQENFLKDKLRCYSLLHIDSFKYTTIFPSIIQIECKTLVDELKEII